MIPTKTCNKCGQEKPITDFHNSSRTKDGKTIIVKNVKMLEIDNIKEQLIKRIGNLNIDLK